jgi:hypothetical protein
MVQKQFRGCGHWGGSWDGHRYCSCCRRDGKSHNVCSLKNVCEICQDWPDDWFSYKSPRSYQDKKQTKEKKELERKRELLKHQSPSPSQQTLEEKLGLIAYKVSKSKRSISKASSSRSSDHDITDAGGGVHLGSGCQFPPARSTGKSAGDSEKLEVKVVVHRSQDAEADKPLQTRESRSKDRGNGRGRVSDTGHARHSTGHRTPDPNDSHRHREGSTGHRTPDSKSKPFEQKYCKITVEKKYTCKTPVKLATVVPDTGHPAVVKKDTANTGHRTPDSPPDTGHVKSSGVKGVRNMTPLPSSVLADTVNKDMASMQEIARVDTLAPPDGFIPPKYQDLDNYEEDDLDQEDGDDFDGEPDGANSELIMDSKSNNNSVAGPSVNFEQMLENMMLKISQNQKEAERVREEKEEVRRMETQKFLVGFIDNKLSA